MSFLAPLFLLGSLAIAAPVIFHLVRRTTRDRRRFSSLMFLQPTPPRMKQRSRLEHLLLLALRAAALALLALAFARPFLRTADDDRPSGGTGPRVVILLDVSASMSRGGLMEAAREKAEQAVEEAGEGADLALLQFDRSAVPLLSFEEWRETPPEARRSLARSRIAAASPTHSGTRLGAALTTAAELLADDRDRAEIPVRKEVVVISDLQEGAKLDGLQAYDWPQEVTLRVMPVVPDAPGNAGLQLAAGAEPAGTGPGSVRVRVVNSGDSPVETCQVGWAGADGVSFAGTAVDVYVPPGQSRMVTVPWPADAARGDSLLLRGDSALFDNRVFAVPPDPVRATVLYAGREGDDAAPGPLFFLRRALPKNRTLTVEPVAAGEGPLPVDVLADSALCVVTRPLDEGSARALAGWIEGGGTALVAVQSPDMAETLAVLSGTPSQALPEVTPDGYAMLGTIDFRHPVFLPFADPRFSDFTRIRFWKYHRLDAGALPGAHVIAQFDSGDPAMVGQPRGSGQLIVLTTGWRTADSQLALSSKFPSLIASVLESTGLVAPPAIQFPAGEPFPVRAVAGANAQGVRIVSPDESETAVEAGASFTPGRPGIYRAVWEGGSREFAVNLDPAESRTLPLPVEELERLGLPLTPAATSAVPQAAEVTAATAQENRQKLWRWCIVAALCVLFLETLLAGWTARRPASSGAVS